MKTTTASLLLILIIIISVSSSIESGLGTPTVQPNQTNTTDKPSENTWVQKAPMPTPRYAFGLATVDGKIYAIGGNTYQTGNPGNNEMYDPTTDTWTTKAAMPTPRSYFAIAVYQNKIYCIGGLNGNFSKYAATWGEGCTVNEVYDTATDTWETKTPLPKARWHMQANMVNCTIYLVGGQPNGKLNQAYDPATDTWTTKAPFPYETQSPVARCGDQASTVVDNQIYWIGRPVPSGSIIAFAYSPENDSWSMQAKPPANSDPQIAVATTGVWAPKQIYILDVGSHSYVYNPINDTWLRVKQPLFPHAVFDAAVVKDRIYLIGGYHTLPIQWVTDGITEEYTPFGYGTVPPAITVQTPMNGTHITGNPTLNITVNKPIAWIGYSIDGKTNITTMGNTTIPELKIGMHNVTVYAQDEYGNIGASQTVYFAVKASIEPILGIAVAGATGALGFFVYYKWRHKKER